LRAYPPNSEWFSTFAQTPAGVFNQTVTDVQFTVVDGNGRHSGVVALPVASYRSESPVLIVEPDDPDTFGHDRDHAFDRLGTIAQAMGIEEVVTAPHAPWQNPFVERFVGSARRECIDHVIALNETGVRRLMTRYGSYYEKARTHLALEKDAPIPRRVMPPGGGAIVAISEVGGLHHRYERRGA
jgi:hypothetical protein